MTMMPGADANEMIPSKLTMGSNRRFLYSNGLMAAGPVLATSKVWVNGEEVPRGASVGDNDEVAVLPPVSGGM